MAFLPSVFDANTVTPAAELGALPAGEYLVAITDSAMEYTKSGDGQFLKLVFTVLDGAHKGAKVFDRLNLINRNPTAVEIAQQSLSAICHATGVLVVRDSAQLHNVPLRIKIAYVPPKGEFGEKNDVKAYKPVNAVNGKGTPGQPARPGPAPAPRPAPTQAPSWGAPPAAAPAPQAADAPAADAPAAAPASRAATSPRTRQATAAPAAAVPPWKSRPAAMAAAQAEAAALKQEAQNDEVEAMDQLEEFEAPF